MEEQETTLMSLRGSLKHTVVVARWETNKYKTRMWLYLGDIDMSSISTATGKNNFDIFSRPLNHQSYCQTWEMAVDIAKRNATEFMDLLCPSMTISWPDDPYQPIGLIG